MLTAQQIAAAIEGPDLAAVLGQMTDGKVEVSRWKVSLCRQRQWLNEQK
jgi:hypothetical protein